MPWSAGPEVLICEELRWFVWRAQGDGDRHKQGVLRTLVTASMTKYISWDGGVLARKSTSVRITIRRTLFLAPPGSATQFTDSRLHSADGASLRNCATDLGRGDDRVRCSWVRLRPE